MALDITEDIGNASCIEIAQVEIEGKVIILSVSGFLRHGPWLLLTAPFPRKHRGYLSHKGFID